MEETLKSNSIIYRFKFTYVDQVNDPSKENIVVDYTTTDLNETILNELLLKYIQAAKNF